MYNFSSRLSLSLHGVVGDGGEDVESSKTMGSLEEEDYWFYIKLKI